MNAASVTEINSRWQKRFRKETIAALTFDTDNCPKEIVLDLASQLSSMGLKATFFCDNPYHIPEPHEAAIHPFIDDFSSPDAILRPVRELLEAFPMAKGSRCHQLTSNGNLYMQLPSLGIKYESSWPMTGTDCIAPVKMLSGLIQFPTYYSDGHFLFSGFEIRLSQMEHPGLKIFSFHPVHIWHNSNPHSVEKLFDTPYHKRYRKELMARGRGIGTLFQEVTNHLLSRRIRCLTLEQLRRKLTSD